MADQAVEVQDAPNETEFFTPDIENLRTSQTVTEIKQDVPEKQEDAPKAEAQEAPEADKEAEPEKKETQADKDRAHEAFLARQARREAREAKEALEAMRRELAELRSVGAKPAQTTAVEPPKPPHPDNFKWGVDDNDFIAAQQKYLADRDSYILNQAKAEALKEFQASLEKVTQSEQAERLQNRVSEIQKRGVDKYADFDDIVEDAFSAMQPDTQALQSLAMQDGAEDVVYYLAKNPEVLERITGLDPMAQAFEMGRMASQFSAKRETPKVQVTKATATPTTPRGANGQFSTSEDALYSRLLKAAKW